jgi:hypothetical protein
VSSRTFSIADFEGSTGGGLTSVGWSAIAVDALKNECDFVRVCGVGIAMNGIQI